MQEGLRASLRQMKAIYQQQSGVDLSILAQEGALVLDKDATSCVGKLLNTAFGKPNLTKRGEGLLGSILNVDSKDPKPLDYVIWQAAISNKSRQQYNLEKAIKPPNNAKSANICSAASSN